MPATNLIKRHLAAKVVEALQTSRIVNIVGPRQAGKSTLVKHQVPIAEYVTMDSELWSFPAGENTGSVNCAPARI